MLSALLWLPSVFTWVSLMWPSQFLPVAPTSFANVRDHFWNLYRSARQACFMFGGLHRLRFAFSSPRVYLATLLDLPSRWTPTRPASDPSHTTRQHATSTSSSICWYDFIAVNFCFFILMLSCQWTLQCRHAWPQCYWECTPSLERLCIILMFGDNCFCRLRTWRTVINP